MLATAVTHIAKRGVEVVVGDGEKNILVDMPVWGLFLIAATCLIFMPMLFIIDYTFGRLLTTIVMIESPASDLSFEPLSTEDPDAYLDPSINKKALPATPRPTYISSSFRTFYCHLITVGGRKGRFRGISIYIVKALAVQWIATMLSALPLIRMVPMALPNIIAALACANLSLAWTNIVISEPSPKMWFKRLPTMSMWKKVAIPTAVLAVAEQISFFIPYYIAVLANLMDHSPNQMAKWSKKQTTGMAFSGLGLGLFALVLALLLVVPAKVALTRVQASLLSDTEETIVPFDRSFGGKVVPEIVGGSGVIGMLDAWKTFDMPSRIRLVKAYFKVVALQFAVTFVLVTAIVLQFVLLAGNAKEVPAGGESI